MPWSLYGRSKSRPPSGEVVAQEAELGSVRRGQSLDISRTLALASLQDDDSSPPGASNDQQKRNRRSSFAAWRSSGSTSSPSSRSNATDGEVELQPGHATPYTAFGVRGGFAVYSSPSSSPASGPRYQYAESQRSEEDDSNEGASLYTPASSITRVIVSPTLTPVDSGFAEFGPDSVVEGEAIRQSPGKQKGKVSLRDSAAPAEMSEQSSLSGHKKTRSRGWFSFNTSAASETPSATTPQSSSTEALSESTSTVRESAAHPAARSVPVPPASKSTKAVTAAANPVPASATPAKSRMSGAGFLSRGQGRKRGDSEVSLKDISQGPL